MFYVSSVSKQIVRDWSDNVFDNIGITDTSDNVEGFYSNRKVYKLIKEYNIKIYGTYCYGKSSKEMYVHSFPLKMNTSFSRDKLRELFEKNKKAHNDWNGYYPIADYLASVSIGSSFKLVWSDIGSSGQRFSSSLKANKVEDDIWICTDDNFYDNSKIDCYMLARLLDYPSCVQNVKIY